MLTTLTLLLAMSSTGQDPHGNPHQHFWGWPLKARPVVDPYAGKGPERIAKANERILPPGPGLGWGFPNNAPDGYGWYSPGDRLPIGLTADRTPSYYFNRQFAIAPEQMFFPTYFNTYVMRGQRYIPYTNCGGAHPAGGPPAGSSFTPVRPYDRSMSDTPAVPVPVFNGRQASEPLPPSSNDVEGGRQLP